LEPKTAVSHNFPAFYKLNAGSQLLEFIQALKRAITIKERSEKPIQIIETGLQFEGCGPEIQPA
jgi:hypothetical protein